MKFSYLSIKLCFFLYETIYLVLLLKFDKILSN
jgi:hypothetical protein